MQNINISDFRANLLKYLEKANAGEKITIMSNGKLLATLSPPQEQRTLAKKKLKNLAKQAIIGDVIQPMDDAWDALQ